MVNSEGGQVADLVIRAGGQTGADRAALDTAVRLGLPYGGWCSRGGEDESEPTPPGLLTAYPLLAQVPTNVPQQWAAWNVRDSHATLLLHHGDRAGCSPEADFSRVCAEFVFLRPCMLVNIARAGEGYLQMARSWIGRLGSCLGVRELHLNVTGPKESQAPGIYEDACGFLAEVLS